MSRIFDTHAHYEDSRFDFDRDALLKGLPLRGVEGVITCGIDIKTSEKALALAETYPYIKAACGIDPQEADKVSPGDFARLSELLKNKNCTTGKPTRTPCACCINTVRRGCCTVFPAAWR